MQANLQKKQLATQEFILEAGRRKIKYALIQEPYVGAAGVMRDYPGVRVLQCPKSGPKINKSAIAVFDSSIDATLIPTLTTENIVVAKLTIENTKITVASIYFEDNTDIKPYLDQLKEIVTKAENENILVGGDANAWSIWWGSEREDERGRELHGVLEELGLHVMNSGSVPTFDTIRGGKRYKSHVDITVCSESMINHIDEWRVDTDITSSDHNAIMILIKTKKELGINIKYGSTKIFNTRKVNWGQFREKVAQLLIDNNINKVEVEKIDNAQQLEEIVNKYTDIITKACNENIPKLKKIDKTYLPWWNENLDRMKADMNTKKRRIRCAAPRRRRWVIEVYLKAKTEYELEASKARTLGWKEFCGKQDGESVWDGIYRVIAKTKKRHEDIPMVMNGRTLEPKESAKVLAETFFPDDYREGETDEQREIREAAEKTNEWIPEDKNDPPFTVAELRYAVKSFNPKKAPGLDGFTADICEAAIGVSEEIFLATTNACLQLSYYPIKWKEAVVVVLRKPNKDNYTQPKSYRPIGLLSVLGKILEKMLVKRLRWHLLPQMSPRQYGFVPQRSTEDALYDLMEYIDGKIRMKNLVVVVSLDIEGAFDGAWWPAVKNRLADGRCPCNLRRLVSNYLEDRKVRVRYAGAEHTKETTKGCVQGSIAGPTFWNLLLDPLLEEVERSGTYCQAFADDVILVFSAKTALEIEIEANACLARVQQWGSRNKLKFAPQKTNGMLMTKKLKYDTPRLHMGGTDVQMVEEIKMLGLIVDNKRTFRSHVAYICKKAANIFRQLSFAAKATWGLNPEVVRIIYMAVIEPIILYAASVWAKAAQKIYVQKQLNTILRGFAQKISKAYRTVSMNSALILTGLLPLDLRVKEAATLYETKRGKPLPILKDRSVEGKTTFLKDLHPARETEYSFSCLTSEEDVMSVEEDGVVQIYTDGSKLEGKVGAALTWWYNGVELKARKFKLEEYCTVFQAELYAVYRATEMMVESGETKFKILSDSRSTLEILQNMDARHPLVVATRNNLREVVKAGKTVKLYWVKAHVGIKGNERADVLAKEAALSRKTRSDYDECPVSFVKRVIRNDSVVEWNRRYNSENTASVTKMFFPCAELAYKLCRKIPNSYMHTQIFTGHGGFSEYLCRFKRKESPACICDPSATESLAHIIIECPQFCKEKFELENLIDTKLNKINLPAIIADQTKREVFVKYCLKLLKIVISRNKI